MAIDNAKVQELVEAIGLLLGKVNTAINTRTAADSAKLEGKTLAQVTAQVGEASQEALDQLAADLAAFVARRDNPNQVTKAQVGLDKVANAGFATQEQAEAGEAADVYASPLSTAQYLAKWWADQLGTTPETLDTIEEISSAITNNAEAIDAIRDIATGKETPAGAQAKVDAAVASLEALIGDKLAADAQAVDSAKLEGKTLAEVLADATAAVAGDIEALEAAVATKLDQAQVRNEIAAVTTPLDTRLSAVEDAVTGGSGSLLTSTSDLGANPVAMDDDGDADPLTLKAHLVAINSELDTQGTAIEAAAAAATAADGKATAAGAAAEAADGKAEAAGTAAAAAQTTADGAAAAVADKLGKTEQAADAAKFEGKSLADLTATVQESNEGEVDDKFVTPQGLKAVVDAEKADTQSALNAIALQQGAQDTAITKIETDVDALMDQLTVAFNDGAALFEPAQPQ